MTQRCPVCGQRYGVVHSCRGVLPPEEATIPVPPTGLAARHYLRQAIAIARFEDAAIAQASRDKNALPYGGVIWLVGVLLAAGGQIATLLSQSDPTRRLAVVMGIFVGILFGAISTLGQLGLCHLLARWWFGATGAFVGVLRAVLLGSVVTWLFVVPVVGLIVASLWYLAVLMCVFEEVDGIAKMQAFGLAYGIGLLFLALQLSLTR